MTNENATGIENKQLAEAIDIDTSASDFVTEAVYERDAGTGLSESVIDYISDVKNEPDWIRAFRKQALKIFYSKPVPAHWAPAEINEVDFDKIRYYLKAKTDGNAKTWDEVDPELKKTFERLGVPEQERRFLAGVDAQFDSESAYSRLKSDLEKQGVIFVGPHEGLTKYAEIFKPWFGKVIPTTDSKYSALNSACFSGGSFVYVPKGVKVAQPLQAYFRINAESFGQFERTLIIADEGAELTYMEGCTAPRATSITLHSGVVELVALKGAKIQYVTVQNWSGNIHNLVTQRGWAGEDAEIKWVDCNLGSRLTMKYPAVILAGERSRGEVLSIALAHTGQVQDTGAKMIHLADNTTSNIVSKSVSIGNGRANYRGLVSMPKKLKGCKNNSECHTLLINAPSASSAYPAITVRGNASQTQHEASVSKVSAEQIFYMQQRGLSETQAMSLAVNGFVNDLVAAFPMEYSVELKRLIEMEMEGSVA